MSATEILDQVRTEFKRRKFAAGLAIAFIDFLEAIGSLGAGVKDYQDFLIRYPRRDLTERGGKANTLIVELPDGTTKSIRYFYDRVQNEIRSTNFRLDYPSAAPHATQAWQDYTAWLGILVASPRSEVVALRASILAFVLEALPSHELDESLLLKDPPVFSLVLSEFDLGIRKGGRPVRRSKELFSATSEPMRPTSKWKLERCGPDRPA